MAWIAALFTLSTMCVLLTAYRAPLIEEEPIHNPPLGFIVWSAIRAAELHTSWRKRDEDMFGIGVGGHDDRQRVLGNTLPGRDRFPEY